MTDAGKGKDPTGRETGREGVSAPGRAVAAVTVEAPAKVNLVLRVLGPDGATGYHRLETVFQAVHLADSLVVERTPEGEPRSRPDGVELEVTGGDVGPAEDNLVTRAARAFLRRDPPPPLARGGVRIRLHKRIPAGAGLGGGSSDAAATLRALDHLFGEPLGAPALHELAASLGSDVPFFLCGSPTALAWGRGERLRPLPPLPPAPVLLVLPGVHVATGRAYGALADRRADRPGPGSRSAPAGAARLEGLQSLDWERAAREAVNDFESVVPAAHPPVARALEALRRTRPRLALLSGSGSAAFGVYRDDAGAAAARDELEAAGHRIVATRTLERMPEPVPRVRGDRGGRAAGPEDGGAGNGSHHRA